MTRSFLKFCTVGVINTLLHLTILSLLVDTGGVAHPPANVVAFLVANTFAFFAHSRWSFSVSPSRMRYARFLVIALAGTLLSYGIMRFGDARGWHYLVSFAIQVALMPPLNFTLMRLLVFAKKPLRRNNQSPSE